LPKRSILLSWSGGKDSSLSLQELWTNKVYEGVDVKGLLTTLTRDYGRISMHGVRRDLLLAQSKSIGMPVEEVLIPAGASNEIYQEETLRVLSKSRQEKEIDAVAFGDLFLRDIRVYREKFLGDAGFKCLFPIWGKSTRELARYFVDVGFKAIVCTVDPNKLHSKFCGSEFDDKFLSEIPPEVDPCGENGEFHTFVYGGPIFKRELSINVGEVVERNGFHFADIIPG
jgi:uncharacterized protein (TIGR00290 family)